MPGMQAYDQNGNPIEGKTKAIAHNEFGYPAGTLAAKASERHAALSARPNEGPGAMRRFFEGLQIPTSIQQLVGAAKAMPQQAASGILSPFTNVTDAAGMAGRVLDGAPVGQEMSNYLASRGPLGAVFEQAGGIPADIYNENYAGALGRGAGVVSNVLGAKGIARAAHVAGRGGLNPAKPGGTPITAGPQNPALDAVLTAAHYAPSKTVRALSRLVKGKEKIIGHKMYDEPIGPPHPADAGGRWGDTAPVPAVWPGSVPSGFTAAGGPPAVPPIRPRTPGEGFSDLAPTYTIGAMDEGVPGATAISPPPLIDAGFGNAPRQNPAGPPFLNPTSPAKKMSGDPNRLAGRFDPFDQSGSIVSDVPPLSPAALQGAESQIGQIGRTNNLLDPEGPAAGMTSPGAAGLPSVAFTPESMQQLMQTMAQMDEALKAAKAAKAAPVAPPQGAPFGSDSIMKGAPKGPDPKAGIAADLHKSISEVLQRGGHVPEGTMRAFRSLGGEQMIEIGDLPPFPSKK